MGRLLEGSRYATNAFADLLLLLLLLPNRCLWDLPVAASDVATASAVVVVATSACALVCVGTAELTTEIFNSLETIAAFFNDSSEPAA